MVSVIYLYIYVCLCIGHSVLDRKPSPELHSGRCGIISVRQSVGQGSYRRILGRRVREGGRKGEREGGEGKWGR